MDPSAEFIRAVKQGRADLVRALAAVYPDLVRGRDAEQATPLEETEIHSAAAVARLLEAL